MLISQIASSSFFIKELTRLTFRQTLSQQVFLKIVLNQGFNDYVKTYFSFFFSLNPTRKNKEVLIFKFF